VRSIEARRLVVMGVRESGGNALDTQALCNGIREDGRIEGWEGRRVCVNH
jgi:hypothetical protein